MSKLYKIRIGLDKKDKLVSKLFKVFTNFMGVNFKGFSLNKKTFDILFTNPQLINLCGNISSNEILYNSYDGQRCKGFPYWIINISDKIPSGYCYFEPKYS